jgi:hypothetical protein
MNESPVLRGETRLEWWPAVNRRVRVGGAANLTTSDLAELEAHLGAGHASAAAMWADYMFVLYGGVADSYFEWARAWQRYLSSQVSERGAAAALPALRDTALEEIRAGRFDRARIAVRSWFERLRDTHDRMVRLVAGYTTAVRDSIGEDVAKDALLQTLSSCSYYDGWWKSIASFSPEERVVVLAEEFRAHFSGPHREGVVTLVETEDAFRMLLNPCGSGGALRLSGGATQCLFRSPSVGAWRLAVRVPAYCVHCAQNESVALNKLGCLPWVTRFSPNPQEPCEWTIFKRPPARGHARNADA